MGCREGNPYLRRRWIEVILGANDVAKENNQGRRLKRVGSYQKLQDERDWGWGREN